MIQSSPNRAPTVIVGIVLAAAPLLFGAVYPWAYGFLEVGVATAFLLWLWRRPRTPDPDVKWSSWGLGCLAAFVSLVGLQLLPLPRELVRFLAEPTYQFWQLDFLPPDIARPRALLPLTLYPFATASEGILFLCYFLAFYLASKLAALPRQAVPAPNILILLIIFAGFAVAAVGIVQNGVEAKAIYGFFTPLHAKTFTGPYVNYNHFAGYLELAIPLGIGTIAFALHSRLRLPEAFNLVWICGAAVAVMATAMFMSRSRGGIFVFCLVTLCQLLTITALLSLRRTKRRFVAFGLVFLITLGVGAHMADWSQTLPRIHLLFHQDPTESIRWKLFKDVFNMSSRLPLTGSGLGTFAVAYPSFKTLSRQGLFAHAHNDYLELLAETGWPGLLLFLGFASWVLWRGGRVVFLALARRNRGDPDLIQRALLITGCLGGVTSLLIHGLVDFNLRIPANALTWFILCGVTVGLGEPGESPSPASAGYRREPN